MKALVTGCSGFIGSHLTERLLADGHVVYGLSRSGSMSLTDENLHLLKGDVSSEDSLRAVFDKVDVDIIFHMASQQPGSGNAESFFSTNATGTINLLSEANENNVNNIILSSSVAVYGVPETMPVSEDFTLRPDTFYGLSKLEGEMYAKKFASDNKVNLTVLRYPGVYGPGVEATFMKYLLNCFLGNKPPEIQSGNIVTDYVYVEDVVNANLLAANKTPEWGFEVFNVGGGITISREKLAEIGKEICGSSVEIKSSREQSARAFDFTCDLTKAQKLLGFEPQRVEDCITKYWEWIKLQ